MRFHPSVVFAPMFAVLAACSGATSSSSSSSSGAPGCTPGIQQACACPGGGQGAQACNAAGTGFDACLGCGSTGSSSSSSASGPAPSSSSAAATSTVMASSSSASASSTGATSLAPPSSSASSGPAPVCTSPTAVNCTDESTLQLNLRTEVNNGIVGNSLSGGTWTSTVDASAGGITTPVSYIYARFTEAGLTPVAITDADAFTRMDWDIALRRTTLRINSGASGPSCVAAAQLPSGAAYEGVAAAPASPTWLTDAFMTPQCGIILDGSGLPTPPATALSPYYGYPSCVRMTGAVFVLRLADGRVLKLTMDQYYNDAAHAECQGQGAVTTQPSGAGNHRLRWAFLPTP